MIVQKPHEELVRIAEALDEAVGYYIAEAAKIERNGDWEAPIQALAMSWGCSRNIEAVTILAKTDEVLLPAAWANARTAFEISARAIWLLFPGDRYKCEMRWIAMLEENRRRYHERMIKSAPVSHSKGHEDALSVINDFIARLKTKIPDNYTAVKDVPRTIDDLLKELGTPELSFVYTEGSQYLHGTMAGTSVYLQNLGFEKIIREHITLRDWILPMRISWLALKEMSSFVIDRLSDGARVIDWRDTSALIDALFAEAARAEPSL